jgi:hypothetical protein
MSGTFMFVQPAFAQGASASDGSGMFTSLLPLILIAGIVFFVLHVRKQQKSKLSFRQQAQEAQQQQFRERGQTVVKTYTGSQVEAIGLCQVDAIVMSSDGYSPTSQSWAPGQWGAWAFIGAIALCFFVIGIIPLVYMLIVKPAGTLTVTYERRAVALEEKSYEQAVDDIESKESTAVLEVEAKKRLIAKTPLGVPWIEPEAVAPVVVFLASDEAYMVSGATYDVTGGDSANYNA